MPSSSTNINLTFTLDRETKGTFRFAEVVEGYADSKVGTVYLKKSLFAKRPSMLTVVISSDDFKS